MTTKKTRIFSQKQMQTQIAQVETLTLPLESALEGLKGFSKPFSTKSLPTPTKSLPTPTKSLPTPTKSLPTCRPSTFSHIFSSARGDDARRRS